MRQVTSRLFITLDGVTESPDQWQFEHFDDDMLAAMTAKIDAQDAVLLGRATYQEWALYWPTATDEPFASFINKTPKYVVSTSLEQNRMEELDADRRKSCGRTCEVEATSRKGHRRSGQSIARASPAAKRAARSAYAHGDSRRCGQRQAPVQGWRRCDTVEAGRFKDNPHRCRDLDLPTTRARVNDAV